MSIIACPSDLAGRIRKTKVQIPPGLYVEEACPIGFGLGLLRPRRNLLLVTFKERTQAARRSR